MVVPGGYPCEVLVRETEIQVGAVLADTGPVVIEREYFTFRGCGAGVDAGFSFAGFVDVVAEVDLSLSVLCHC